jgi:(p)ppGpp synthase/HD superfamily hydrolase
MKSIAELARIIAFDAHKGQTRRDGKTPYFEHLKAVVSRLPDDDTTLAVGWLHDVLEDTDYTPEKLQELGVPDYVVFPVIMITKQKCESYEQYIEALRYTTHAKQVKVADILSNLADTPTERQIIKYAKALIKLLEH